jgi:hypothetical protein
MSPIAFSNRVFGGGYLATFQKCKCEDHLGIQRQPLLSISLRIFVTIEPFETAWCMPIGLTTATLFCLTQWAVVVFKKLTCY